MNTIKHIEISDGDSLVIKIIKEKLNRLGGEAIIKLYKGDDCDIRFDKSGRGLSSSKIPPVDKLIWEVFDATVELLIKNGGRAKKGNAQSGARLGNKKLELDSVEGYIAHKVYGVPLGGTSFGPGFVIYAILEWVGICNNERGILSLKDNFSYDRRDK